MICLYVSPAPPLSPYVYGRCYGGGMSETLSIQPFRWYEVLVIKGERSEVYPFGAELSPEDDDYEHRGCDD